MSTDPPVDGNLIDFATQGDAHRKRKAKKDREPSQASRMTGKAWELADLFHDNERTGYATIPMGDHRETWAIRSQSFRHWITQLLFEEELGSGVPLEAVSAPSGQAVRDAIGMCEALAIHKGRLLPVYRRIAGLEDGRIAIDLANEAWEAILVSSSGWTVVSNPPVRFLRSEGVAPLPYPEREGSLDELRPFLNLASGDGWPLVVGWLIMAFRPRGPYPVLALSGEQGAAKTTAGRLLRALVDPSRVPDRTAPRDERDLAISSRNAWVVNLDNLSSLPAWLSDALARLATGAGLSTRQLYTDADEVRFYAQRPTMINGITSVVTRGDLLDRSILVELAPIPASTRRTESDLWAAFETVRPRVLGALLDAVSVGIGAEAQVRLASYPRMADFARWVVAAEPALGWAPGGFLAAYRGNQSSVHALALDVSPVAIALRDYLSLRADWEGTATALLDELTRLVGDEAGRRKNWPTAASVLGDELRRLAPDLRAIGITIEFARSGSRRTIHLARRDAGGDPPSSPSPTHDPPSPGSAAPSPSVPLSSQGPASPEHGNDGSDSSDGGYQRKTGGGIPHDLFALRQDDGADPSSQSVRLHVRARPPIRGRVVTREPSSEEAWADHGTSAEPEAVAAMPGSTGGLQPPAPPMDSVLRVEGGSTTPHRVSVRDDTAMPDDAEVSPTPAEPDVDLVAMALDIFGDMLTDVSAEAEASLSWRCWVGPGHEPALRDDGSVYCQTCHPATVGRSRGPMAAPTRLGGAE